MEPVQQTQPQAPARLTLRHYVILFLFSGAAIGGFFGHPLPNNYLYGLTNCRFGGRGNYLFGNLIALLFAIALFFYSILMPRLRTGWRIAGITLAVTLFVSWPVLYTLPIQNPFGTGFARWARTHVDADALLKWSTSVRDNPGSPASATNIPPEELSYVLPLPVGSVLTGEDRWPAEAKAIRPFRVALLANGDGILLQWLGGRLGPPPRMVYLAAADSGLGPAQVPWPDRSVAKFYEWRRIAPEEWIGFYYVP